MDESVLIPKKRFRAVVREITYLIKRDWGGASHFEGEWRWESDALVALQSMTEHIVIMLFEMWYVFFHFYVRQRTALTGVKNSPYMPNE